MIVLSLFDGIACWYEALQRAWIPIDVYFASEIDKYAIKIAEKNHPKIIEIGDINDRENWRIPRPDIIIGGSPCQWFSMAWKMLNFNDPRSKLFFKFVDIVNHYQPKYFLLENVKMKNEHKDKISELMWVQPIEIDSALVSAQRRKRLYRTNIPGVTQPEDKGIMIKDILEENAPVKYNLTERWMKMLTRNFGSKGQALNFDPSVLFKITYPSVCEQQEWLERKSPTLTASMGTGWWNVPCIIQKVGDRDKNNWGVRTDKSYTIPANPMSDRWQMVVEPMVAYAPWSRVRKLTPIECERLQTLPDNYTEWVSDTQRYKALGNGRTVDVIAHIFTFINKQQCQKEQQTN